MSAPYLGDFRRSQSVQFQWHSFGSSGQSITRSTNGTISVYKDNGVTQTTTGVTDTEDFDSLTGVHVVTIATTDSFYVPGSDYTVVLSAATIDTQAVNAVLAHFSIENRFNGEIRKATAQGGAAGTITLDASASATDDFYNGGTVLIESGTGALQQREISDYVGSSKVVTVDRNWVTNPDNTSVFRIFPGSLGLSLTEFGTQAATSVLTSSMTEVYHADGAAATLSQAVYLIMQMLTEASVSGTTLTVKKLDGTTSAATFTLNDASSPTSITRAT